MRITRLLPLFLIAGLFWSCETSDVNSEEDIPVENRWSDATLRKIHDHQDASSLDSLAPYFEMDEAIYRKEAALACASMRDYPAVPLLIDLLADPDASVAAAAAYALGQTGDTTATPELRKALADPNAVLDRSPELLDHLLEALGKLGNRLDLDYVLFQFADLKGNPNPLGLMRSIYRFGLRNINSRAGEEMASDFILDGQFPEAAQLAASYFARRKEVEPAVLLEGVFEDFSNFSDPIVRMNLARATQHLDSNQAHPYVLEVINNPAEDYRTKVNALLVYQGIPDTTALELVPWLQDNNHHVAFGAAFAIQQNPRGISADTLAALGLQNKDWIVRSLLYQAAIGADPTNRRIVSTVEAMYMESESRYERGLLLMALSESPGEVEFLRRQLNEKTDLVDRSYSLFALNTIFGNHRDEIPVETRLDILKEALNSGDDGLIATAASELASTEADYADLITDTDFLEAALDSMELPAMLEGYRILQRAIYKYRGDERQIYQQIEYNHPIDWEIVGRLAPTATADLVTTRGTITLELMVEETPATVANFVELAESGHFDKKFFHRVVPNFVIQGGCPRGDGYGSLSHTLRTEVPPVYYGTGAVGMASAGPDTESCQLFITHSPTPHLDGRYSLFARVVAGMDVVHEIRMADRIESVTVNYRGS